MKKFSNFVKAKQARTARFTWGDGDLATVESLDEWTAEKPLKHSTSYDHQRTHQHDEHRFEFANHDDDLSKAHREHMDYYKGDSYSTNHYLRHGKHKEDEPYQNTDHMHDHIKHMDHVTSYQTKQHHTSYRGGVPSDLKKFKPGHKFQDHGYTGTSLHHDIAAKFADHHHPKTRTEHGKKIIHVIHSPPGTKAHYVDVDQNRFMASEHEMVLHRGTKFKVTHHSEDPHHHYIHSRVVGHKPKKLPHGFPGHRYSKTGFQNHEKDQGVTITKHEDEKPHIQHKIKFTLTPKQHEFLKKHKANKGVPA